MSALPPEWDQRTLKRTKPCAECPYRKVSAPGWLGGHSLDGYAMPPSVGMPTSCHCSDHGAASSATAFCAGSLALIANDPDVEPLPEYEEAVAAVGPRDDCISTVEQFRQRHAYADKFRMRLAAEGIAP